MHIPCITVKLYAITGLLCLLMPVDLQTYCQRLCHVGGFVNELKPCADSCILQSRSS